jgi:hypothetical protein
VVAGVVKVAVEAVVKVAAEDVVELVVKGVAEDEVKVVAEAVVGDRDAVAVASMSWMRALFLLSNDMPVAIRVYRSFQRGRGNSQCTYTHFYRQQGQHLTTIYKSKILA